MRDLTVLAATLQHLHRQGKLVVSEASDATGLDASTIYRWIAGEADPSFGNVVLLFKHCDSHDVQAALLGVMTSGTSWLSTPLPTELDIDGDGDVDIHDAIKSSIDATELVLRTMRGLHESTDQISNQRRAEHEDKSWAAIRAIVGIVRIVGFLNERCRRRKKARPVVVGALSRKGVRHG